MTWQADVMISGEASGDVLRFDAPISFWGGVDPRTSRVTAARHPQRGQTIADKIVVLPQMIGSGSSSAILLELIYKSIAPRGLILGMRDAILPMGVLVAEQMGWPSIPVVVLPDPPFQSGDKVKISSTGLIEAI